jgi:hypothetical protein
MARSSRFRQLLLEQLLAAAIVGLAVPAQAVQLPAEDRFVPQPGWTTRYESTFHCATIEYVGPWLYNQKPSYQCGDEPWHMVLFLPDDYRGGELHIAFADPNFVWGLYFPDLDTWTGGHQEGTTVWMPEYSGAGSVMMDANFMMFNGNSMSAEYFGSGDGAVVTFLPGIWQRVPEPATPMLLLLGMVALLFFRRPG